MMSAQEHLLQMKACKKCQYAKQAKLGIALIEAAVPPTLSLPYFVTTFHCRGYQQGWGWQCCEEVQKQLTYIIAKYHGRTKCRGLLELNGIKMT